MNSARLHEKVDCDGRSKIRLLLECAEQAVAGVSEAGEDETVRCELVVNRLFSTLKE